MLKEHSKNRSNRHGILFLTHSMLPRALHFLPYFPPHPGGIEMYAREWAENYVIAGGKVAIVTFSG